MVSTAPIAVDLFSGAGGLAEGLLKAGVQVAASVELHPQPALTHAFNHSRTQLLVGDIRELNLDVLDAVVFESSGNRTVDVVAGGPPCQGFSSAGRKIEGDPRNSLFRHYIRVVAHLRPRMFVMENVPGFKTMYGGAVYAEALAGVRSLGYETKDCILHAKSFGVPQRRKRFVMVGWQASQASEFQWPHELLYAEDDRPLILGQNYTTAGEALDDLAFLEPGFEATRYHGDATSEFSRARRSTNGLIFNHLATQHRSKALSTIQRIPVGGSIRDIPVEERGSKKLTMSKLDPSRIANTVVSLPDDMLHYAQDRILTVRETARLQTFDDDFVFFGKRTSGFVERRVDVPQYTQVGNAVPPLLGEVIGGAILESLDADRQDLRERDIRVARHDLVTGTSGYSGYELAPNAKSEIRLRTVTGNFIELPISADGVTVAEQPPILSWASVRNPRKGQWAPGVLSKANPSWMGEGQVLVQTDPSIEPVLPNFVEPIASRME